MPSYLSPGVYVEEVSSGSRPIEGVGTALAAFVGLHRAGPVERADARHQLDPVHKAFGGFVEGAYLPHAVYGYFLNGGGAAYVVRVGADRRRRERRDGNAAASRAVAAARGELPPAATASARVPGPRAGRRSGATTSRSRSPTPSEGADEEISSWWSKATARSRRPSTTSRAGAARSNVVTVVKAAVQADHDRGDQGRGRWPCRARAPRSRWPRPAPADPAVRRPRSARAVRRRLRRAHRLRRARGDRGRHDALRPRPDDRLPERRDRRRRRQGRPAGDDRALRADGATGWPSSTRRPA